MRDVYEDIRAERERQPSLGYTAEHDDQHGIGHLTCYAAQYARESHYYGEGDRRREKLVKAAALLVAAIESHERKAAQQTPAPGAGAGMRG